MLVSKTTGPLMARLTTNGQGKTQKFFSFLVNVLLIYGFHRQKSQNLMVTGHE
jgi:hypothetical protein